MCGAGSFSTCSYMINVYKFTHIFVCVVYLFVCFLTLNSDSTTLHNNDFLNYLKNGIPILHINYIYSGLNYSASTLN